MEDIGEGDSCEGNIAQEEATDTRSTSLHMHQQEEHHVKTNGPAQSMALARYTQSCRLSISWHLILERTSHSLFRIAATKRAQLTAITQNGHLGPHVNPSAPESPTGSRHGDFRSIF